MSLSTHHLLACSPSRFPSFKTLNPSPPIASRHLTITPLKFHDFHFPPQNLKTFFNFALLKPSQHTVSPLNSHESHHTVQAQEPNSPSLDSLLSFAELLCIVSSAIIALTYVLSSTVLGANKAALGFIGSYSKEVLVWGFVVMTCGMAIGAWIRRRQWQRICWEAVRADRGEGGSVNLVERVEKLEEDLKSSATIIRVLSRQLEKLGIRFRVTRKSLKQPLAETAALAQKNSEATRALAVQEDILEKELGEIQKVLLAMQEHQQKQLELILAIAKTSKLWENKREPSQQQDKDLIKTSDLTEGVKQLETQETQSSAAGKGNNNDRSLGV